MPDGYSKIFRLFVYGPSGFWTMAPLRCDAKFDPFLSLDCAPTPTTLAQSKERKGSNFAAQRSGAIVQKPEGPNSKNLSIAIWQLCVPRPQDGAGLGKALHGELFHPHRLDLGLSHLGRKIRDSTVYSEFSEVA